MGNKLALITGASSGIGAAYARTLAAKQHDLILVARREDRLQALAQELARQYGVEAEILPADLTSDEGLRQVEACIEQGPTLDMFVHSAGFGTRGHFADVAPEKLRGQVLLHDLAAVRLLRAAIPAMRERGVGQLILISSLAAFFATAEYTLYSASKAFLNTLAQGLDAELAPSGVRVQVVCPGLVRTGFMETEEYKDFSYDKVPALAWMEADEVVVEAMASLDAQGPLLFVPGRFNRLFVQALNAPGLGTALKSGLNLLSRKMGSLY